MAGFVVTVTKRVHYGHTVIDFGPTAELILQ
jgi:hypothetical protein